jgi:L-2-hydroxycarboxylate dehydrogenase (NAD+)
VTNAAQNETAPAQTITVSAESVHSLIRRVLIEHGASEAEAGAQADMLTEADLRGQHSHGVQRLKVLVGRIRSGALRPGQPPSKSWVTDTTLSVNGNQGFGPTVAYDAIDELLAKSEESGIAMGLIRNSNHMGMLAPYVEAIAAARQIGIVLTTSEALVHPWGGSIPLVGTNPIAIGIPTLEEPFVLDMATAAVSMGKILSYAARNEEIPPGWGIDSQGTPATNASEVTALSPFGGPKGYALGLAFEVLVGGLTQTALGTEVHGTLDTQLLASKGDVIMTLSPERLGISDLGSRAQAYFDIIRTSPRSDPSSPVLIPGDRARTQRTRTQEDGIRIPESVWAAASELSSEPATAPAERRN